MQCAILLGGLGTRIRKISGDLPKALIPINGRPFLAYQLDLLSQRGVNQVVLLAGYRGDLICEFLKQYRNPKLHIEMVDEGKQLLGTGGAVRNAAELGLLENHFLVTYGDSYLPVNYVDLEKEFLQQKKPAVMAIYKNENQFDKSNVKINGDHLVYDKHYQLDKAENYPYIDYGVSAIDRQDLMNRIPTGEAFDLAVYFGELSKMGLLGGHIVTQRFYEIGSIDGYNNFVQYLQEPHI